MGFGLVAAAAWLVTGTGASAPDAAAWSARPPLDVAGRMPAPFTLAEPVLGHRAGRALGAPGALRSALVAHGRAEGFPLLGFEPQGPDRSVEARFVLDGEVRAVAEVAREGAAGRAVEIWWQLLDRRHEAVIYEVSTIGWAPLAASGEQVVVRAFGQVLARERFVGALEQAGRQAFFERGEPLQVRRCTSRDQPEDPRDTVITVGRGGPAGVVVSADGWAWVPASGVPAPGEPIVVHTARGRRSATWYAANAAADVAILSVAGSELPCAPMAPRLPHAAEAVALWSGGRRPEEVPIHGFLLQQEPPAIVLEAAPSAPSAVLDRAGALVGLTRGAQAVVQPHYALREALRMHWSWRTRTPARERGGPLVDDPDPGFVRLPDR